MTIMVPEAIAALRECLREPTLTVRARRHVERALRLLCATDGPLPVQAALCVRDGEPCSPDYMITALRGRCGRDAP